MKATTHTRLRRTAAEAVASIPGIEAVVLYGSRARGTARETSDWDIAILSHAAPDDERAAQKLFDHLDRVHHEDLPVEWPERTAKRIGCTLRLQTAWLG